MRALFGFDPESGRASELASTFESGLGLPRSRVPDADPGRARYSLRPHETRPAAARAARQRRGRAPAGARTRTGTTSSARSSPPPTRRAGRSADRQVLDHVLTLLFAGHDTTTSTVSFLALRAGARPRVGRAAGARARRGLRRPRADPGGALRRAAAAHPRGRRDAPPLPAGMGRAAAVGSRLRARRRARARRASLRRTARGCRTGCPTCSRTPIASTRTASTLSAGRAWPRGAYVPFGMGPRVCIGKRFGYTEVHAIAAALLRRFTLELPGGFEPRIRQAPTLSVAELPVRLSATVTARDSERSGGRVITTRSPRRSRPQAPSSSPGSASRRGRRCSTSPAGRATRRSPPRGAVHGSPGST